LAWQEVSTKIHRKAKLPWFRRTPASIKHLFVAAPEWASPALLPNHRGLVDATQGSLAGLGWWVDLQVDLLKPGACIALSHGEGLL